MRSTLGFDVVQDLFTAQPATLFIMALGGHKVAQLFLLLGSQKWRTPLCFTSFQTLGARCKVLAHRGIDTGAADFKLVGNQCAVLHSQRQQTHALVGIYFGAGEFEQICSGMIHKAKPY